MSMLFIFELSIFVVNPFIHSLKSPSRILRPVTCGSAMIDASFVA